MQLTLSYFQHCITFCSLADQNPDRVPLGYHIMTDANLDDCLDTLLTGRDVWVWVNEGMRQVVTYCKQRFQYVKAAGGLLLSPEGCGLLIERQGQWDLPKGMVERGESLKQAAQREVTEETGVKDITVNKLIIKTYHIYNKYGGWHLKQTSWYAMTAPSMAPTQPQTEEDITQALWLSKENYLPLLNDSFASLHLLAQKISDSHLQ